MWPWALTCPKETGYWSGSQTLEGRSSERAGHVVGVSLPSLLTFLEENWPLESKFRLPSSFSQGKDPEGSGRVAATLGGA